VWGEKREESDAAADTGAKRGSEKRTQILTWTENRDLQQETKETTAADSVGMRMAQSSVRSQRARKRIEILEMKRKKKRSNNKRIALRPQQKERGRGTHTDTHTEESKAYRRERERKDGERHSVLKGRRLKN
jgi:hypothetical protein